MTLVKMLARKILIPELQSALEALVETPGAQAEALLEMDFF
jgi:hypothetical protein